MKKKRIFKSIFILMLIVILHGSTISQVVAALQALPVSQTPYNLRDRFDTDLFTGSASYSYDIKVPKGTDDLTPDVAFAYNSSGARDLTQRTGMGWQMSSDFVERDINFTPTNTSDDKFKLRFKGGVYDLVYVSADGRYHTKIESHLNIQKLTGGSNEYSEYWQVTTPDGTKYRFGQASNSELVCNGRSYVSTWNLDQVTDVHDNKIYYTYTESNGASYVSQIKYNNDQSRIVDFTYATSPYQRQVYTQGCNVTESSRLTNIQVKINTTLVRQYDLAYTTAGNSQSQLQSITEKGSDGSSLPATTFEYKPEIKTWSTSPTSGVKWLDHQDIDAPLNMTNATLSDVNGDNLPDIVKSEGNGNNTWKVWKNNGSSWATNGNHETWINNVGVDAKLEHASVRLMDVTGDNLPDIVKADNSSSWKILRNTGSSWSTTWEQWGNVSPYSGARLDGTGNDSAVLVDVTGDGLPDIVNTWWNGGQDYRVFRNTGNGWSGSPEVWSHNGAPVGLDNTGIRLFDANGDGLADIVRTMHSGTSSTWHVYKNNGSSFNTSAETWINNANVDAYFENENVTFSDVNGDGLVDIVKSDDLGTADKWKVLLNQGNSWSTTYEIWIDPSANVDVDAHNDNTRLADINGDGLTDIVKGQMDCSCGYDTYYVWKNNGNSPDLLSKVTTSQGGTVSFDYGSVVTVSTSTPTNTSYAAEYFNNKTLSGSPVLTRTDATIDFDWGGGSPGGSVNSDNFSARWTKTEYFDAGTYTFTATGDDGIRLYIDNELVLDKWIDQGPTSYNVNKSLTAGNHTVIFEYYENGGGAVARLKSQKDYIGVPFPVWLVSKMTVDNGLTNTQNTNDITTYSYKDGYYKWQDKEFRGFKEVNTTEANGGKRKYVFNQDDALKGKMAEVQYRDSSSNPYAETQNTWNSTQAGGVYFVNLASEKNYTYDGAASNPKVSQTDYQYDNYGNVTKKSELGDTSVTGDERFTYNDYIYNPTLWIVDKLAHTTLKKSDDNTKIAEQWQFYDNDPNSSPSATLSATSFGDGSDGDITISSNTTEAPTTSFVSASAGSNVATVGIALGFFTNQIVLLHQTQGTNAGTWEYARVQSYSGGTLTLTTTLANSYSSSGSNHAQIRVVPQYHNVTVNSGATWTPKAWDGTSGGILAFLANGTVTVNGAISATGRGFRGGASLNAGHSSNDDVKSLQGEGTGGASGYLYTANGNGGGGSTGSGADGGNGGGGGGNGTAGTNGGAGQASEGVSGGSTGTADLTTMSFGGGGGGGRGEKNGGGNGGNGGNGGGIVFISAAEYTGAGTIAALGNAGANATTTSSDGAGGGGGAAGGSILLKVQSAALGSSLITATGDTGGARGDAAAGNGGAGGTGRIRVQYETSLTGTTNPSASTNQSQIPLLPAPVESSSYNSANLTKGDLTKKFDWLSGGTNPQTTYAYDSFGNQTSVTDANSHTTTQTYEATGTYPTSTTNAKSQLSLFNYDLGTGNLLSKTDPNSLVTSYEYDVFGRIKKEIKPYDSSTYPSTSYSYFLDGVAPEGVLVSKRETASASATLDVYSWSDGLGRVVQNRTEAEDTSYQIVKDTFYDPTGEVLKETVPHLDTLISTYAAPVSGTKSTNFSYDPIGRLSIITNPKGDSKTVAYDHWKETTIDENGHIKREFKNASGKIDKVEEVNGINTYSTTYEYDSRDLLKKITDDASNITTFVYDSLGRKTSQTDPDMGTWTYGYDAVGNLTSQTDARNIQTTKTYDELDRVTLVNYPTQTDNSFLYDVGKIGTLAIATDSAGTVNYAYDNRLRKTQEQRSINGTTKTTQWTYDSMDRTVTTTYPDGEVVAYEFNSQGEINSVGASASALLTNIDYSALGKIIKKDFANGLSTNYSYNTDDFRLNRIQTGTLQDLGYTYDAVGNVNTRTNNVKSKTEMFSYDDLDRLKTASESGGYKHTFQYNSIGNITNFTSSIPFVLSTSYAYGANGKPHSLTTSTTAGSIPNITASYTFTDNWSSGSIDTTNWNDWGSPQTSVVSNELKISSTTTANNFGVNLITNYNLTGSFAYNKVINSGDQSLASWKVYPVYIEKVGDPTSAVYLYISGNTIWIQKRINGVDEFINKGSYNSSTQKYFRIRESAGAMYFDTSSSGGTWTNLHSFANPFNLTSIKIGISAGTSSTEAATTSATFDFFAYSTVPTANLKDTWSSIDASKWNDWGGVQTNSANNELKIESTTAANYHGVDSITSYDLTSSRLTNQLINAGNQSLTSWEANPVYIEKYDDATNAIFFYVSQNKIWVKKKVNNVDTIYDKGAYNSTIHKYFKISESGGITYFDTSTDGVYWTRLHSFANPFNLTSLKIGISAGTSSTEAATTSAIFDNLNTLPVGTGYNYDANGNLTSDTTNCYQYNEANQLDKVTRCKNGQTIAEYVYDYNGNRMVKRNFANGTLANTVTSWSDAFETKAIVGGATENTSYYFANGQLIAKKDNSGTKTYFHNDHLGSTSLVTNQSGALVESTTYDPWGGVKLGGTASKFLYTGQEYDSESKLHYYNARYYDSNIRRFTQPDDIIQDIYSSQSLNRYSYVWNNPLKYTDPTGHAISCDRSGCSSSFFNPPPPKKSPDTFSGFLGNISKPPPNKPNNPPKQTAPPPSSGGGGGGRSSNASAPSGGGSSSGGSNSVGNSSSPTSAQTNLVKGASSSKINIGALGICGNANLGMAAFGTGSGCVVGTSSREIGFVGSIGGGGSTGLATGLGINLLYSPTINNLNHMKGQDVFVGGSAEVWSFDMSWNRNNPSQKTFTSGPSLGVDVGIPFPPVEFHGGSVNNYVIPLYKW